MPPSPCSSDDESSSARSESSSHVHSSTDESSTGEGESPGAAASSSGEPSSQLLDLTGEDEHSTASSSTASSASGAVTFYDLTAEPGGIYRVSKNATLTDPVLGVYASNGQFEGSLLPRPDHRTRDFVRLRSVASTDHGMKKNAIAICFFGIWRNLHDESVVIKSAPVTARETITVSNSDGDSIYKGHPEMIWSRSMPLDSAKILTFTKDTAYELNKPTGTTHTEIAALKYLQNKEAQNHLWKAIVTKFGPGGIPTNHTLEGLGISIYSRLDACDSCLKSLSEFNSKGFEYIPPGDVSCRTKPVPCVVSFDAHERYNPDKTHYTSFSNGLSSATLCVLPKHPFLKIGSESDDLVTDCCMHTGLGKFKHADTVALKSGQNPSFIIFRVNSGAEITMGVPT